MRSKVDLVIGTSNFSGSDLTGFNINNAAILTVSVADELNLVSQFQRIKAQTKANNTLRVLAGNHLRPHDKYYYF